jgi:hypothetical protein
MRQGMMRKEYSTNGYVAHDKLSITYGFFVAVVVFIASSAKLWHRNE